LDSAIFPDYMGIGNGDQKGVKTFLQIVQAVAGLNGSVAVLDK